MKIFAFDILKIRLFVAIISILQIGMLKSQDIYIPIDGAIYKVNVNSCVKELIVDLKGRREENPVISSCVFHPNGGLYIFSEKYIYIYGVLKNESINRLFSERIFPNPPHSAAPPYYATINEKGIIYFTSVNQDKIYNFIYINPTHIQNMLVADFKDRFDRYIGGYLKSGFLSSDPTDINNYHVWMPAGDDKTFHFSANSQYQLSRPVYYYPPCGSPQIISIGRKTDDNTYHLIQIDHGTMEVTELCENINFNQEFFVQMGLTSGFRQSQMRLDLDADNSSRHITDGYYDTLTTCSTNVRIYDDDIDINTCGKMIDSISFHLAYLDDQPITNEKIFIEDGIKRSPSRWVWRNSFSGDLEKIKDHLKSITYVVENEKEYDHSFSFQRVVITTLYAEGDSTSSWTVIRLLDDAINAGLDTTVLYCPGTKQINLEEYLSGEALTEGDFNYSFSGGDEIFQPGIDEDGEYLYIAGNDVCFDTAVFTIQAISPSITELDTFHLCSAEQVKTGFPLDKYTDILWWDGSSSDSIVIQENMDVTRYVELKYKDCPLRIPIVVLINDPEDLAGQDTTVVFCPKGQEIDLSNFLTPPKESVASIYPELQKDGLIFTPGTDPAGIYQYILNSGGCADTATITMEESATLSLHFGPVFRCSGQDVSISLPSGDYEHVKWWNGEAKDSTVLMGIDPGPFYVEAQKDGCLYRTEFEVVTKDVGGFPEIYPDTLKICADNQRMITVQKLDSIKVNGQTYTMGESMKFSGTGDYTLTGFVDGCPLEKSVNVETIPDPSASYQQIISWCEDIPLTLSLPQDSADIHFSWSDGTVGRERKVAKTGKYFFTLQSDRCTFQTSFTILAEEISKCNPEDCLVAIPNAISPNGDGWNDKLDVFYETDCVGPVSVALWDKWGNLQFKGLLSDLGNKVWRQLSPGMYVIQITFKGRSEKTHTKTESLFVIK